MNKGLNKDTIKELRALKAKLDKQIDDTGGLSKEKVDKAKKTKNDRSIKDLLEESIEEGNENVHIRVEKETVSEDDYEEFLSLTEGIEFETFDRAVSMAINHLINNGYTRRKAKKLVNEYIKKEWA